MDLEQNKNIRQIPKKNGRKQGNSINGYKIKKKD
jgi:hypothetical protein